MGAGGGRAPSSLKRKQVPERPARHRGSPRVLLWSQMVMWRAAKDKLGTAGFAGIAGCDEDMLHYEEEGCLEEGKIVEEEAGTQLVMAPECGVARTVNTRKRVVALQKLVQKPVQCDMGGVKNIRRTQEQRSSVLRGKSRVVLGAPKVVEGPKVVRVISVGVGNSSVKTITRQD
ncbi:hypothetical protein NDU88_002954 [Pleurodeles waltl]|uniref:Uncharacterized protein n=1 Tax=Pleurodeles waltl TaxID=8319 RepID=A0AAV7WN00_PLEWA|nr:hypothetical protein NDU88_002954 [Pleurodeles waltl]